MKGLFFLWGLIRGDIRTVQENIRRNFENYEIEFIISTWENQVIDDSLFLEVIRTPFPTTEYLDSIKFPYTQQIKTVPEWHHIRLSHYAQFYHNYRLSEYLKEVNENYSILGKSRADLTFNTNFQFNFEVNMCYVPEIYWPSRGVGINDHFMVGNFNYMNKVVNMQNFSDFFPVIENSWNPETVNQKLILMNGCNYTEFPCNSYLLLPDRKML